MASIHISEAEAARDFSGVMARVRAGDDVFIDSASGVVAVVRRPEIPRRTVSEMLAMLKDRAENGADELVMSDDFARDVERRILERKPRRSAWD